MKSPSIAAAAVLTPYFELSFAWSDNRYMWLGISKGELIQLTMPLPIFKNGLGMEGPSGESSAKAINGMVKINTIPRIQGIPFVTMFLRLVDIIAFYPYE
jgi:hypothetical protein